MPKIRKGFVNIQFAIKEEEMKILKKLQGDMSLGELIRQCINSHIIEVDDTLPLLLSQRCGRTNKTPLNEEAAELL